VRWLPGILSRFPISFRRSTGGGGGGGGSGGGGGGGSGRRRWVAGAADELARVLVPVDLRLLFHVGLRGIVWAEGVGRRG
jgi:hypothetical protein